MSVNVIYRDLVVEVEVDETQLVYDGLNWMPLESATSLAVKVESTGSTASPPISSGGYFDAVLEGWEIVRITGASVTGYVALVVAQMNGLQNGGTCNTVQVSTALPLGVLRPGTRPAIVSPRTFGRGASIGSGDWTGVNVIGNFFAGEDLERGYPLMLVDDKVYKANSSLGAPIIGFANMDTFTGKTVGVLVGKNSLTSWLGITGTIDLIPGAAYYVGEDGVVTLEAESNTYVGLAMTTSSMMVMPSGVNAGVTSSVEGYTYMVNAESDVMRAATVVAATPNGVVRANTLMQYNVIGIVCKDTAPGGMAKILVGGILRVSGLELANQIVGSFDVGDALALSFSEDGKMEVNPDTENVVDGSWLVRVGTVLSNTSISFDIQSSVEL